MASTFDDKPVVASTYDDKRVDKARDGGILRSLSVTSITQASVDEIDLWASNDPVLDAKMNLVNTAIDDIGWTGQQTKLFFLNGFGYAADSLTLLLQTITASAAHDEYGGYPYAQTIAVYSGMLAGAIFWGFGADVIGRRTAFNCSLFICGGFAIICGASPNWAAMGTFNALSAFGAGGNLILDTAVFLEFCPSRQAWLLTLMAAWWGIAPVVGGAFAWPFMSQARWNCSVSLKPCTYANNMGWRYMWYSCGTLVLFMAIARITVIRLHETPKFLLGQGRDADVVKELDFIANKYHRTHTLTVEQLEACGHVTSAHSKKGRFSFGELLQHLRGLFATKKLGLSTALIWFSWTLIGLAYPLYYVFLPAYLASRNANTSQAGAYYTWRNYLISNTCGIFGPVLGGFMANWKWLGRKYTMVIGGLLGMVWFFCYTQVRTPAQNLAFSCMIGFFVNIYYGTLYAYTPEVLPSAHRATGNGIAVGCNRIMGIMSAVIAQFANVNTPVPIYICAALFGVMALVAAIFPFEPYGRRSM